MSDEIKVGDKVVVIKDIDLDNGGLHGIPVGTVVMVDGINMRAIKMYVLNGFEKNVTGDEISNEPLLVMAWELKQLEDYGEA